MERGCLTKKKTYEKPQLITLSEKKIALGWCQANGSGDLVCNSGSGADPECRTTGISAGHSCDPSGSSAEAYCWTVGSDG